MTRAPSPLRPPALAAALLALGLAVAGCASPDAAPASPAAASAASPAPADAWLQWADPTAAGFDAAALEALRERADELGSAAVMVVHRGRVVAAWGDVARELELHSVRKSLYAALYGVAVERGLIDLDATLGELGVDDHGGLTETERRARVEDLLAARSGVFLPAAYAPADQDEERPERGSHPPGSHWFYNNWDFNVSAVLLERAAGRPIGELFDDWIAGPIGMEDYRPSDVFAALEPRASRHPALTFRMSTRDLARFGLLWLEDGEWNGRRVLPAGWVERASSAVTSFEGEAGPTGRGYGFMWWTYEPGSLPAERYPHLGPYRILVGTGTGGQVVAVVPEADLVFVHRGDTDHGRPVSGRDVWTLLDGVLGARTGVGVPPAAARFEPLDPVPLASQLPPLEWPDPVELTAAQRERLVGRYEIAPGVAAEIFVHDGRLFGFMPGKGEAELFALSPTELFARVDPSARIRFAAGDGPVQELTVAIGGREMTAGRVEGSR